MALSIVLVEPSHPGNIGGAARAMKNMGLSGLRLVNPKYFPDVEATSRASGADDLLANATVFSSLSEAIADQQLVYATTGRGDDLPWPLMTARACGEAVAASGLENIAIVFGTERTGLTTEQLALCHHYVHIPTEPDFSSLNLAAAVQVLCYEVKMAGFAGLSSAPKEDPRASSGEVAGFLSHLKQVMTDVQFFNGKQPKRLEQRLQGLFARAELTQKEVNILRGFLSAVEKQH